MTKVALTTRPASLRPKGDRALRDETAARLEAAVSANAKETGRTLDLGVLQPEMS
jgi:hypothetical protein